MELDGDQEDFVNHLPPGYRFHPTDDEIINYYLTEKIMNPTNFIARAIAEVDLNKCEPWDLPEKAKMGEKEWYFFCQRDRKYPTGMRTNRATQAGYWKATGKDREIISHGNNNNNLGNNIGMKKTLVFYQGRAPKGTKTNWVMHEYRLDTKLSHQFSPHNHNPNKHEEWVVCRVFYKRTIINKTSYLISNQEEADDHKVNFNDLMADFPSLPPLTNSANTVDFTCTDPPPLSMDNLMFNQQHRLIQYQLPFTHDPLMFHDTHIDSSGLTMRLGQLTAVQSSSTYTNDINVKKESISWYNGINYDDDPSIVGGTISDSELDNLWNSSNY